MTAVGKQVELFTILVLDGNELVGVAPWYLEHSRTAGSMLRFLGSGEACSDYLSLLCRPDRRMEVVEELADWLTRPCSATSDSGDCWDILELAHVTAADEIPKQLGVQLCNRGVASYTCDEVNTWRLELPRTLDDYFNLLSKSHRKQLRRFQRRFFDTGHAVLRTVERAEQIAMGWTILADLHQRRMESLGHPGCFKSDAYAQFHIAVTEALFRAGRLHLHWLEFDGRPVAAEYHLAGDGIMYAYQGGIDPGMLQYEPGRLITLATLERAIAGGYRAFDFCRGDESYKAHWRAKPQENCTWRFVSNRPRARLRQMMWHTGQQARKWVKGTLELAGVKAK